MLVEDLKTLVAVIEHNSLTGAAAAMCLTQSAISRRIQHLEEVLDATLFDRNSKPPKANALAHRIYVHALPLLRDVRYLLDIPRSESMPTGVFRLGLTQVISDIVLVDSVSRIRAEFPSLELQIRTEKSALLLGQVEAGSLDAATLMLPAPSSLPTGLAGLRVATLEMMVVQSKNRPLVADTSLMEGLASQEWVLNPNGCGSRGVLERTMANYGKSLKLVADTQGSDMQLRLVAAGLGLGFVSMAAARQSRHFEELSIVNVPNFKLSLDIWLVYPTQIGNLQKAAIAIGDSLQQAFTNHSDAE
jgi:DNA-binding transcriptional LysR family regulator